MILKRKAKYELYCAFKETARKELYALPDKIIKKILAATESLSINPRPVGVKKLKGKGENLWRIRIGDIGRSI